MGNGAQWEANVAGALWDIYDARDDRPSTSSPYPDSLSDGFTNLWNAFRAPPGVKRIRNVYDAQAVYESLYAHPRVDLRKFALAQRIFMQHGMTGGPNVVGVEQLGVSTEARSSIERAFPNPFNPLIRIAFTVPAPGPRVRASLRVYDVSGRLVRTLLDGSVAPGRHEAAWDGRTEDGRLAGSGVYVCRLECRGQRASAKLTLLR